MKKAKKREYDSTSRKIAASVTRQTILEAAREIFVDKGYAATTMPAIAQAAGVALDTVYATVGKKPAPQHGAPPSGVPSGWVMTQ